MSRIGKQPVVLPEGVDATIGKTSVTVEGPHGTVESPIPAPIRVEADESGRTLNVSRPTDSKSHRALHGLTRSLLASAVQGVRQPYKRILDIVGVGYTAKLDGDSLTLSIGFCHPVRFEIPDGIKLECPTNQRIVVEGCNKQQVGQFAANIRRVRPPEPYNGKGIRYQDERVIRKAGKSFVSGEK